MDTLEALAAALRRLEGDAVGDALDELHDVFVAQSMRVRGRAD
jgi:hypothetical protein